MTTKISVSFDKKHTPLNAEDGKVVFGGVILGMLVVLIPLVALVTSPITDKFAYNAFVLMGGFGSIIMAFLTGWAVEEWVGRKRIEALDEFAETVTERFHEAGVKAESYRVRDMLQVDSPYYAPNNQMWVRYNYNDRVDFEVTTVKR